MTTGAESQFIRHAEACAVTSLWRSSQAPVIATTASRWGNLMEAGGIAEIGFLDACYRSGSVPKVAVVELPIDSTADHHPPIRVFNPKRPHALILRTTPWGEYTCLLVKMGAL